MILEVKVAFFSLEASLAYLYSVEYLNPTYN